MGHVAAVYHVREGDASLEVLHLSGKHFQGRVWNKDTFSNVQSSSSTVVLLPVSDLIAVMASLMSDLGYVTEGYP